jgi:4'-phosphopantetheinyl transferase EntD
MHPPIIIATGEHLEREAQWLERARETMPDVHPRRQLEWALGRVAWELAMAAQGFVDPTAQWRGHQRVEGSALRFSLSHTKGYAGAWVGQHVGMGLDIESRTRAISEEIQTRMAHAEDLTLAPLELWCLKEAAYKSLPAEIQQRIWLNSIAIKATSFEAMGMEGRWDLHPHEGLIVARAWFGQPANCA